MLPVLLVCFFNFYFVLSTPFLSPFQEAKVECKIACNDLDPDKINVHFIPHSHDDVGWLKTYQQYYDGSGDFDFSVKTILDSTIKALDDNPERRYIQVETAFFYKWWLDQNENTRDKVKSLVNNGQLEMINGAWSMNDEASASYQSIIDQFTWGFRILEDTVGECGRPKIGWQIDPFGHSREHASILRQLGFDGLVIVRIDFRDKTQRKLEQNLDFYWNANDNFAADDAKLFTTILPNFYNYENGFCFDRYCDDANITDNNVQEKVTAFKVILDTYKKIFKTNNIMIPMGGDFTYQQAKKNFDNLDKFIEGFKDDADYNVMYSTPSCYISAVKDATKEKEITLTEKSDDFFPYASDAHSFWTGYFTSRPTSKRFERVGNNILQTAKQLTTFSRIDGNNDDVKINSLRMAMGVMQHHDAITGTEKQAVTDDYTIMLNEAIKETEEPVGNIITNLLKQKDTEINLKLSYCLRANMSICENSQEDKFVVAVQNPLSKTVSHYVKLPVSASNYKVTGPDDEVQFDVFDTIHAFDFVDDGIPATKELVFLAQDLPPLGVKLYYVEKIDGDNAYHSFEDIADDKTFGDDTNGFTVDDQGLLSSVTISGETLNIQQNFYYYKGYGTGDNHNAENRDSGAYIFRPKGDAIVIKDAPTVKIAKGTIVDEIHQVFDDEVSQIIRVYKNPNEKYIEFDWLVGNLAVDADGREVITQFKITDPFESNEIFYTDSNGRQQIERHRNQRSDYDYESSEEPVSSNYYPITSKIVIKSDTLELAVLNDRPQGGSSLADGVVELMVHRRDTHDDSFGVGEALNEHQYGKGLFARGQHYLTFGKLDSYPATVERDLQHKKLLAPVILVGNTTDITLDNITDVFNLKFEGLSKSLPDNVQILTLEPWKDSYILRLEHIFEKDEDSELSKDVTVDLTNLFTLFNITELYEMTLGANKNVTTASENTLNRIARALKLAEVEDVNLEVTLKPMEIKTYVFTTDKTNKGGEDNGIPSSSKQVLSSISLVLLISCLFMLL